ncbi:MAG: arylsulfotransferase family protein [Pseudomonadota bacterium]
MHRHAPQRPPAASRLPLASALLALGVAACSAPPDSPEPGATPRADEDFVYLVSGCEIRSPSFELLRSLPGHFCAILPDGNVISSVKDEFIGLIDARGDLQWRYPESIHHDMSVTSRGTVIGLTNGDMVRPNPESPEVRFDAFIELATDGSLEYRWSSAEHHAELAALHPPHPLFDGAQPGVLSEYERFLMTMQNRGPIFHDLRMMQEPGFAQGKGPPRPPPGAGKTDFKLEYYHFNSVQRLDENPLSAELPAFRAGNYLLSENNFSFIFIVDQDTGAPVWSWTLPGYYPGQHGVRLQPDGHLTMLVNTEQCGADLCSSVVEIDPRTGERLWEYHADPPRSFHAAVEGWIQKQPSGGFLVSYRRSEVFEISPEGQVLWRWHRPKEGGAKLASINFERAPRALVAPLLEAF